MLEYGGASIKPCILASGRSSLSLRGSCAARGYESIQQSRNLPDSPCFSRRDFPLQIQMVQVVTRAEVLRRPYWAARCVPSAGHTHVLICPLLQNRRGRRGERVP